MEKFFKNTRKFIFIKQKDILSSVLVLALMIVISRIFGFLRYRTLASFFSKEVLDLFFASFRIPDFVFEILISGALSSAFIPIFIKYEKDQNKLNNNISSIINFMMIGLFLFILIMFVLSGVIIPLITPGFTSAELSTVISLSRILLISQLPFLVAGNILSGMAQANKIFIITAIAPILYNLGIILGTILLSSSLSLYGPAIGVTIGAFLFFAIQVPTIFIIKFEYNFFSRQKQVLSEFVHLFIPRLLSVITTQIDVTIDLALTTIMSRGSYTIFYFAQHLQLFPVSFLGMAFGQASLPYLSDLFKEGKIEDMKKIFVNSVLQLFFLTIPISFFFIFARTPIVRIFFGGEKFDLIATSQTAETLSYFALSLPMHAIFYFVIRAFYATYDTKTPFFLNLFSVGINTILSLIFVFLFKLPVWCLAIAFSISISLNVLLLLRSFYKKIGGFDYKKMIKNSIKICGASFVSSIFSYPLMKFLDGLVLDTTRTINVFILLTIIFSFFTMLYLFLSWFLNIEEVYILGAMIIKIKDLKKKLIEVYTDTG